MTRPRVKICGITRDVDAQLAVELGADAIGFVFWPSSPRAIAPAVAGPIARQLPEGVTRVGVFVNATPAMVTEVAQKVRLDAAQLHGDEDVDAYADCGVALWKAVALQSPGSFANAVALPNAITVLVDAHAPVERGGTGLPADWTQAARLAASRPIVLAGGLHAGNVLQAIERVRPWAIDVSSGVEDAPGVKNADKMRALFAAVGAGGRDRKGLVP
jgi:phosphoribosylanthranilate isomerase